MLLLDYFILTLLLNIYIRFYLFIVLFTLIAQPDLQKIILDVHVCPDR